MNSLLIKNGTIVGEQGTEKADVLISGGKIEKIGQGLAVPEGTEIVNAEEMLVLPGLIDSHTHYHLVSRGTVTADSFEQGSKLASFGGVSTVVDFADHNRGQNLVESAEYRINQMKDGMAIDYTLHQGVYGFGYDGSIPENLEKLKEKGIKTLKIFTTYRETGYLIEEREKLSDLFKNAKRLGMLVTAHCEYNPLIEDISKNWKGSFLPKDHADLRPAEAEAKAIEYYGSAALEVGCPLYVVHLSSEAGLNAIRELRRKGATIYAETTPTYLFLDRSYLEGEDGSLYVMTPPLRTKRDNEALKEAIIAGEIQVVATDHCAFTREQKLSSSDVRTVYPGIPGTEELFHLLYTEFADKMPLDKIVSLLTVNPAKLFGIYPQKGTLKVGSDADICIYNPKINWTLNDNNVHSASGYTPFRGFNVKGKVCYTFLRGKKLMDASCIENDGYKGVSGEGQFIPQC